MKKNILLSILSLALALALPVGSAFAASSPNADSPNVNSPNVNSPNVNSPNVNSPNVDSPNVDSPNVDSPVVETQARVESNIAANTLGGSAEANAPAGVQEQGVLLSPHSGAVNLGVVAGGTVALFVAAGVAAWALRRKLFR